MIGHGMFTRVIAAFLVFTGICMCAMLLPPNWMPAAIDGAIKRSYFLLAFTPALAGIAIWDMHVRLKRLEARDRPTD